MIRLLCLLVALVMSFMPANADPYVQEGGNPRGFFTNTTANIAASDTAVTLSVPSGHIRIQLSSGSAIVYLDLNNGTATSADYAIPSGGSFEYNGRAIEGFHVLGASATGTISIAAW